MIHGRFPDVILGRNLRHSAENSDPDVRQECWNAEDLE